VLAVMEEAIRACGEGFQPSPQLLGGFSRLLMDVNWKCLAVEPALPLGLCLQAAAAPQGRLAMSAFTTDGLSVLLYSCGTAHAPLACCSLSCLSTGVCPTNNRQPHVSNKLSKLSFAGQPTHITSNLVSLLSPC
jgi:hypothetical protein